MFTDEASGFSVGTPYWVSDGANQLDENQTTITVDGEEYKIIGNPIDYGFEDAMIIPFTSLSDDTPLSCSEISIVFESHFTLSDYRNVEAAINSTIADVAQISGLDTSAIADVYYIRTLVLIAFLISILSAINLSILYNFIIESDKERLIILHLCGCSRTRAILISIIEIAIESFPLFIISQCVFAYFILPRLTQFFPYISDGFTDAVYIAIFLIYLLTTLICMLVILWKSIRKSLDFRGNE